MRAQDSGDRPRATVALVERELARRRFGARGETCTSGEAQCVALAVERVEQHERKVALVASERLGGERKDLVEGLGARGVRRDVADRAGPSFLEVSRGRLGRGIEDAAHLAFVVSDGTEREREERLLEMAVTSGEDALVFDGRRLSGPRARERIPEPRPRCSQDVAVGLPEGLGMFRATDRHVPVVVEGDVLRAPRERERERRREAEPDARTQSLRPRLDRAEGGLGPVGRVDELAHLPAATEKGSTIGGRRTTRAISRSIHHRSTLTPTLVGRMRCATAAVRPRLVQPSAPAYVSPAASTPIMNATIPSAIVET